MSGLGPVVEGVVLCLYSSWIKRGTEIQLRRLWDFASMVAFFHVSCITGTACIIVESSFINGCFSARTFPCWAWLDFTLKQRVCHWALFGIKRQESIVGGTLRAFAGDEEEQHALIEYAGDL